jgi:hypothetical protein
VFEQRRASRQPPVENIQEAFINASNDLDFSAAIGVG